MPTNRPPLSLHARRLWRASRPSSCYLGPLAEKDGIPVEWCWSCGGWMDRDHLPGDQRLTDWASWIPGRQVRHA